MTPPSARRFPPPWSVAETHGAFRVDDANGQALGYFYFRDDDNVARQAGVLKLDEARILRGCQSYSGAVSDRTRGSASAMTWSRRDRRHAVMLLNEPSRKRSVASQH